jgi:2-oxoglutarate ferredoxin oxidoreductase subunit gamma
LDLELYICGIGGQGIQLVAKTLALAALNEKRHVLLASEYGFTMRGGSSHAMITIGSARLNALPVLANANAAMILHQDYLETPLSRLNDGALVITDKALLEKLPPLPRQTVISVDAAATAREIGNPMATGMVMLASFCAITGLVSNQSLIGAMETLVPSYRKQHIETNRRALALGEERTEERHPIDLSSSARSIAA